jgi:hypothetical protein
MEELRTLHMLGTLLEEIDPTAPADAAAAGAAVIPPEDLETLRRLRLIRPDGPPTTSDLRLLELVAASRDAGFTAEAGFSIENIALYRDAVERLIQEEIARVVAPALGRHHPQTLRDMVHRGLPIVDQLLALLHRRAVQEELRRLLDPADTDADQAGSA